MACAVMVTAEMCFAQTGHQPPSPSVYVERAVLVDKSPVRQYVGMVEAIQHVDVMPRVTGWLLKTSFAEGSLVKKGDLLFELEDTTYKAAVEALEARREALKATLAFAESEFKRNKKLFEKNVITLSAFDNYTMQEATARASLKEVEASLLDARNNLNYTKIYSPIDGRIGKAVLTPGNLVTPQSGKLVDIEMAAPIHVRFSMSEKIFQSQFGGLEGIRDTAVVNIRLADGLTYGETAKVTLADNKINASANTITLWATFPNADGRLLSGGFVTVLLGIADFKPTAGVAPAAVVTVQNGHRVYVVDDTGKASARSVKLGSQVDGIQLITEGIQPGELIVTGGTHKVQDGMVIIPVKRK